MNRKAFSRINYGLFIIGAQGESQPQGCVVNSLHQVTSSAPIQFSMTMNQKNETYQAIQKTGSFSATVLARDTPKDLVDLFGYKSGRVVNKFDGFTVGQDGNGNPYIPDHALARFACKVVDQLDLGGYVLFIAEVTEAEVLGEGPALTVDDYKNGGGTTPATATVYRTLEGNEGWRCTVCGYVTDQAELPEGYQCPICRASRDKFVKL
ncbi:MAG: flavin reductase [Lawsonibacter sp.]